MIELPVVFTHQVYVFDQVAWHGITNSIGYWVARIAEIAEVSIRRK